MNLKDKYVLGRSVADPPAGDTELQLLQTENRALAELADSSGLPAPSLSLLRERACGTLHSQKENKMLNSLFAGRGLALRLGIAAGLLACFLATVVLAPQVVVTPAGPRAGYPTAWAEYAGHTLVFDFGAVIEIPEGATFHGEGNFMTLSMARAVVERLRGEVRAYAGSGTGRTHARSAGDLGVFAYRVSIRERRRVTTHAGQYVSSSSDLHMRYMAGITLLDPTEAPVLQEYLAHVPQLPKGELVDSTLLSAQGVPDFAQPGVTIGLQFDPVIIHNLPFDATPEQRQAEQARWEAYYKPHYEIFSYPAEATETQIEAHLAQWLVEHRPFFDYTVDVTVTGSAADRDVTVNVEGLRDYTASDEMGDPKNLYGPMYVLGLDGELIEVDPRKVPIELPQKE